MNKGVCLGPLCYRFLGLSLAQLRHGSYWALEKDGTSFTQSHLHVTFMNFLGICAKKEICGPFECMRFSPPNARTDTSSVWRFQFELTRGICQAIWNLSECNNSDDSLEGG